VLRTTGTGKGALMTDEDIPLCVDRALCMAAWEGHTETVRVLKNWKRRGKKRASGSETA